MFSNRIRSVGLKRYIVHFLIHSLRLSFHVPQAGVSSANGQQFGFAVTVLPHRKHFPRDNIRPGAPGRQPILPRQVTAPQQAFLHTDNPGRTFAATYLRPPTPVSMRARSDRSHFSVSAFAISAFALRQSRLAGASARPPPLATRPAWQRFGFS